MIEKEIEGYPNYSINTDGKVIKLSHNYTLSVHISNGYPAVHLNKCGRRFVKTQYIHRLLALTFIPNPENKPQVNHINGIKTDNRLENLEWCTNRDNIRHAFSIGLSSVEKYNQWYHPEYGDHYESIASLRRKFPEQNLGNANLSAVRQGKRKRCKGWMITPI